MNPRYRIFDTDLGPLALVVGDRGVLRILLPDHNAAALRRRLRADYPDAVEDADLTPQLVERLSCYAAGDASPINLDRDDRDASAFDRTVWQACAEIPFGQTVTYAELARRAGRPKAARAVGAAMARNRWPIAVPCHRVIRADGQLGGFNAPAGVRLKQTLLDLEQQAAALR